MELEAHATIHRPLEDVFGFFRDMDQHAGREGSVVPVYDKITPGLVGVGTCFREVVRVLPFLGGEVISEINDYGSPHRLDQGFLAFGMMNGELSYRLEPVVEGVRVSQRQTLRPRNTLLKMLGPLIGDGILTGKGM